jgi:hypothetical protein
LLLTKKKRTIEEVNGGNNSTNSENIDPDKRVIHIHGRMEHNLAEYAKYDSYGRTKILGDIEFTRKIDYNRKDFF